MNKNTFGNFLTLLRKERSMTQKELGEKLGVSDKTISHWERDKSMPDIGMIPTIAEFFGVSCDELLKGKKSQDSNTRIDDSITFEQFLRRENFKLGLKAGAAELIVLIITIVSIFIQEVTLSVLLILAGHIASFSIFYRIKNKLKKLHTADKMTEEQKLFSFLKQKSLIPFFLVINTSLLLVAFFTIFRYTAFFDSLPPSHENIFLIRMGLVSAFFCLMIFSAVQYYISLNPSEKSKFISQNIGKSLITAVILVFSIVVLHTYTPYLLKNMVSEYNEPIIFENMDSLVQCMETEKKPLPYTKCEMNTINVMTDFDIKNGVTFCRLYSYETEELIVSFKWLNFRVEQILFYTENDILKAEVSFLEPDTRDFDNVVNKAALVLSALAVMIPAVVCVFKIRKETKS